ncbi:APC family permease [Microbacterium oleivorans]|uniref:APC family permease n=1 Tax=Microbacterium oleivorans TaxID=273677 RepID=UPI00203BCE77|nr:APC family permease [Microbacterium oleivorans]MCM3695097.1 APC family permease [Microbacterium oleivorans]
MTEQMVRPVEDSTRGALQRSALGTWGVVFMVISAAAPLSVLAGIGPLAVLIGGPSAPLVYAIAGVVLAVFAIGFVFTARNLKPMGGFYTYITAGLGRSIGLSAGALAWVSYNLLQIGLWGLFGVMAEGMLGAVFGLSVPWYVAALIGVVLVFGLAILGVDVGAKVLGVLLTLETAMLVILGVAILTQRAGQLDLGTFAPDNVFTPSMLAILGFGFAAFMGFESTVLYRNETRDPEKSIPRATYIAVAFLAIFYAATLWLVIQAFGSADVGAAIADDPASFFFVATGRYVGEWGVSVMFVLIVSSIFAGQLAFHNAINRYSFALSRDGILPAAFARTNRRGAPWFAGVLQSIVAAAVVVVFALLQLDPLTQLVILVNSPGVYGIVTLQLLASIAVVAFILRNRSLPRKWYVLPAAIVSIVLMAGLLIVLVVTIDYLTGGGPTINAIILAVVPLVVVVGLILATLLRRRDPGRFDAIGGAVRSAHTAEVNA